MRLLQIILLLGITYVVHGLSPFEKRRNPNRDDGFVIFFSGEIPDEDLIKGNLTNFFKQLSERLNEVRSANASNQGECLEDEDPDFIKNSIIWTNESQPSQNEEKKDEYSFTKFRFVLADDAILRAFVVVVTIISLILCYYIT